jgi:hypothetical protein
VTYHKPAKLKMTLQISKSEAIYVLSACFHHSFCLSSRLHLPVASTSTTSLAFGDFCILSAADFSPDLPMLSRPQLQGRCWSTTTLPTRISLGTYRILNELASEYKRCSIPVKPIISKNRSVGLVVSWAKLISKFRASKNSGVPSRWACICARVSSNAQGISLNHSYGCLNVRMALL